MESSDLRTAYHDLRHRVVDLVTRANPDDLEALAPAAPEWRVRDVIAHLTGITTDIVNGNLEGVASDRWTAAQVDARRASPITDVIDEWQRHGAAVDTMIPDLPRDPAQQLITDAATHEHDIRGALGSRDGRTTDAVSIGTGWLLGFVGVARTEEGAGALAIETTDSSQVVGNGEPTATVRVEGFELFRAMTGRRSLDQIRSYDWSGDARPQLLAVGFFQPRSSPLHE